MSSLARTADTPQERRQARRRDRFAAQRVLWRESTLESVRACGQCLAYKQVGVQLRISRNPDGTKRAGFAGLQTCGSVWSCPTCSAKILGKRQTEISTAVDYWVTQKDSEPAGQVAMLTFTMKHKNGQLLKTLWSALSDGWAAITSGRVYSAEKEAYGVATTRVVKSGKRAGQTVPTHVLPWLRVVEVTHGANGWHVHAHVIVCLPAGMTEEQLQELYDAWWKRWNSGLKSAGVDGSQKVNTAEFITGREVSKRVGTYVTKNTYTAGDTAGLEAARGDLKKGRFGNRAIFQVLGDLVLQPEGSFPERDAGIWAEYEQASKGRRQMTWAGGARELLCLDEVEQTDEEIASEEVGTSDDAALLIRTDAWAQITAVAGRKARLLDLAENAPLDALRLVLEGWGVHLGVEWMQPPRS